MSLGSNLVTRILVTRILAIALVLSGCASGPQHLTEEKQIEIRNIAIVSLVPESVNFDKIGIISYVNRYTEFDMGSKVTDNILSISQERTIKSHPNWTIKSIEYDRTALLAKVKSVSGFRATLAKGAFADLVRNNNLDAILVVRASADEQDNFRNESEINYLREGLSVLLKTNNFDENPRLSIRANLSVGIIGKNGEVMALGSVPAKLDKVEKLDPDTYELSDNMKHNLRPEVLEKLGGAVIVDLTRRLNLCFDSLGFVGKSGPESQHIEVVPQQPAAVIAPKEKPPVQAAPSTESFDQCFSKCRQYTDRTKEQCFDACNK
jgi:hypothetical protein